jgi:hypothetical protein
VCTVELISRTAVCAVIVSAITAATADTTATATAECPARRIRRIGDAPGAAGRPRDTARAAVAPIVRETSGVDSARAIVSASTTAAAAAQGCMAAGTSASHAEGSSRAAATGTGVAVICCRRPALAAVIAYRPCAAGAACSTAGVVAVCSGIGLHHDGPCIIFEECRVAAATCADLDSVIGRHCQRLIGDLAIFATATTAAAISGAVACRTVAAWANGLDGIARTVPVLGHRPCGGSRENVAATITPCRCQIRT